MAGGQRLSRAEREQRDERVLRLFLAGETYRQIGQSVGLRSVSGVHRIVQREMAEGAARREVLTDDALALWVERTEGLLRAHWDRATRAENPDHRSAEMVRKLLGQQAKVYGVGQDVGQPTEAPTPVLVDQDPDNDEPNELERLRAKRNRTGGSS